jgi:hypothetical protein
MAAVTSRDPPSEALGLFRGAFRLAELAAACGALLAWAAAVAAVMALLPAAALYHAAGPPAFARRRSWVSPPATGRPRGRCRRLLCRGQVATAAT